MVGNGLNMKDINEIKRLHKLGFTKRQISRTLKIHRNTVSKYLNEVESSTSVVVSVEAPELSWTRDIDWEKVFRMGV
ncbi:MAG: helix-turn-helix domain-containing protein [Bdellovibrio sp.]